MLIERLTADGVLKGLDCGKIEVVGIATLDFYLGEICVRQQVWIAEIKEDYILGADFLMKQECVIDYPQNVLRIGSTEVPMHVNTDELKCLRIVLDRTIKASGNSEMVISAKLDATPGEANCGAIGPAAITRRTKGIIVGRTLVDLKQKNIPVVVNLSSSRKKLSKGTAIAVCEPVACITPMLVRPNKGKQVTSKVDSIPEHLHDLYEKSVDGLNKEQSAEVASLLINYNDVFSKGPDDIGRARGTKHKINTGGAQPIKQAPRRLPVMKRDEAVQAIKDMAEHVIVEPSMSPWSSPVVLVRKKDGTTRFCVDYRRLNDVTRKDSFPLPRVDVTLEALNGSKWFSTMDLKIGY